MDYFGFAPLARKVSKNVKNSGENKRNSVWKSPKLQPLILRAAYLWPAVGGVLWNGVCVSVFSLGRCLCDCDAHLCICPTLYTGVLG